jgi:hypothetical protein
MLRHGGPGRGERQASVGAKTALLVYSDQHPAALLRKAHILDRHAASALAVPLGRPVDDHAKERDVIHARPVGRRDTATIRPAAPVAIILGPPSAGRGLVRRVADQDDLRRKWLVITDDGTQLPAERREAGLENLVSMIADRLSNAERTAVTSPSADAPPPRLRPAPEARLPRRSATLAICHSANPSMQPPHAQALGARS